MGTITLVGESLSPLRMQIKPCKRPGFPVQTEQLEKALFKKIKFLLLLQWVSFGCHHRRGQAGVALAMAASEASREALLKATAAEKSAGRSGEESAALVSVRGKGSREGSDQSTELTPEALGVSLNYLFGQTAGVLPLSNQNYMFAIKSPAQSEG